MADIVLKLIVAVGFFAVEEELGTITTLKLVFVDALEAEV